MSRAWPSSKRDLEKWSRRIAKALVAQAVANDGEACDERPNVFSSRATFPFEAFLTSMAHGLSSATDVDTAASVVATGAVLLSRVRGSEIVLQTRTLCRLIYTAVFVSVKLLIDQTVSISDFALITRAQIRPSLVRHLEVRFVELIEWRLHVSDREIDVIVGGWGD